MLDWTNSSRNCQPTQKSETRRMDSSPLPRSHRPEVARRLLGEVQPEERCTLLVKVVELLVEVEAPSVRLCQFLVADSSACALCQTSSPLADALAPGRTVRLINVLMGMQEGHMLVMPDLWSSVEQVEDTEEMLLINLRDNVSWTQYEFVNVPAV